MLKLNLKQIAKERHIDRLYTYLVKIGLTPKVAGYWARGEPKSIDFFYLELVCNNLKCEPHDIIEWVPSEEDKQDMDKSPLKRLLKKPEVVDIKFVLRMLPKEELDELLAEVKKRQDKLVGPDVKFQGHTFLEDNKRPRKRRR